MNSEVPLKAIKRKTRRLSNESLSMFSSQSRNRPPNPTTTLSSKSWRKSST